MELPFARKGLPLVRMGLPFARMKMTVARKKITPARTERALIEQVLPFERTEVHPNSMEFPLGALSVP